MPSRPPEPPTPSPPPEPAAAPGERREILALVPARGGSKGIPGKNLRPLGGRPLLAWSLDAAREAPSVTRIVVSTDDPEIASCARRAGAEVIDRPPVLASDTASSESALLHALDHLRDAEGYEPELVVFLQATSPLRAPGSVEAAIARFDATGADSLFSASPLEGFVWRTRGDDLEALTYDPKRRPRRQEIGQDFLENGSIYLLRPEILRRTGNRLGGEIVLFAQDPLDGFQVDSPADLEVVERLVKLRPPRQPGDRELTGIDLLVLDFDGVLTDNRVLVGEDGREAVACHRGDGMGIERLRAADVEVAVLSKEANPVVRARCDKLQIPCVQGLEDKLSVLEELARERGLGPERIAFVGNDVNDLAAMGWAGLAVAVADAEEPARRAARWVTERPGGHGAVREVAEALLAARTRHARATAPTGSR